MKKFLFFVFLLSSILISQNVLAVADCVRDPLTDPIYSADTFNYDCTDLDNLTGCDSDVCSYYQLKIITDSSSLCSSVQSMVGATFSFSGILSPLTGDVSSLAILGSDTDDVDSSGCLSTPYSLYENTDDNFSILDAIIEAINTGLGSIYDRVFNFFTSNAVSIFAIVGGILVISLAIFFIKSMLDDTRRYLG